MPTHSRYRRVPPKRKAPRWRDIVQRFYAENIFQVAAAMAFATLLALVPLVSVVLSIGAVVPYLDPLLVRLDQLVQESLLPAGAAGAIAGSIGRFSHKAQQLTVGGIAALAGSAFLLMHTIERTFNHLWRVEPRPILARIRLYAFSMAVFPFLLAAVALAVSYAVTTSLGFFDEARWIRQASLKAVSMGVLGLFFVFLYRVVPNARVSWFAALFGAVFATIGFSVLQKIFELYLVKSAMFRSIYGAFAAFPVFLIWLHLCWVVVLLGGLMTATCSRGREG